MRIILMSAPSEHKEELKILPKLFDMGLEDYHLRKPHWSKEQITDFLTEIDEKFHHKIIIHYHFDLIHRFALKGIHLGEQQRIDMKEDIFNILKNTKGTVSSSVHSPDTLRTLSSGFSYIFCSPIFESISKKGYAPKHDWDINSYDLPFETIGMGGVTPENVREIQKRGFDGVGVLGLIWSSDTPIENFKKIQASCVLLS